MVVWVGENLHVTLSWVIYEGLWTWSIETRRPRWCTNENKGMAAILGHIRLTLWELKSIFMQILFLFHWTNMAAGHMSKNDLLNVGQTFWNFMELKKGQAREADQKFQTEHFAVSVPFDSVPEILANRLCHLFLHLVWKFIVRLKFM